MTLSWIKAALLPNSRIDRIAGHYLLHNVINHRAPVAAEMSGDNGPALALIVGSGVMKMGRCFTINIVKKQIVNQKRP